VGALLCNALLPLKEKVMNTHRLLPASILAVTCAVSAFATGAACAQTKDIDEVVSPSGVASTLSLTAAQRSAIYRAASADKSKVSPAQIPTRVGANVPPMIELYTLPDNVLAENPVAKLYQYTMADDQVVLVDPTKMEVIAVIGRKQHE
jgi:hypothetical protein